MNQQTLYRPLNYLALGDSIATGTLTQFHKTQSYADYFYQYLIRNSAKDQMVYYQNLANNGDTSSNLLWRLKNYPKYRRCVEYADIITVSIGGNNLLQAVKTPGFNAIRPAVASRGIETFCRDWPLIVDTLRELNPNCTILAATVYNPYNQSPYLSPPYGGDYGLFERAQGYICQINDVIAKDAPDRYQVVDVYNMFANFSKGHMGSITCMYNFSHLYIFRNPHPNPVGHRKIAALHSNQMPQLTE